MVRIRIGAVGMALLLAACQTPVLPKGNPGRGAKAAPVTSSPRPNTSAAPSTGHRQFLLQGRIQAPASLVSNNGGSVVSNGGGNVVSNGGGNVITNGGANFRLLATLAEAPVANARVRLIDAAGQVVTDAQGKPLETTTDAAGGYGFTAALPTENLVLEVALPADKGTVRALVPKDLPASVPVNGGLVSTLTTGYILDQYVKGQADRQATLDRLPAAVEAETRERTRLALEGGTAAVPETLTAERVVAEVERLRDVDPALDAQFEKVRELLIVAGQQDLGNGQLATEVPLPNVRSIAALPDGSIDIFCHTIGRLYRVGPDGRLRSIAGNGSAASAASLQGVKATEAAIGFARFALRDDQGRYVICSEQRVVRLRTDGALEELWPYAEEPVVYFAVPAANEAVLVAASSGIWEVGPGGQRTLKRPLAEGEDAIFLAAANLGRDAQGRVVFATKPLLASARDVVYRYDAALAAGGRLTDLAQANAQGLLLDPSGHLFVYRTTNQLELAGADGAGTPFAGNWNDPPPMRSAQLTLAPDGSLLLCRKRQVFRVKDGIETLLAGSPESAVDSLNQFALNAPTGLVVLPSGELAVASYYDHRLYRLATGQEPVAIAGNGTNKGVTKGPVLEVELQGPQSLKRGPDGAMYTITAHNRLIRLGTDGQATVHHNVDYTKIWLMGLAVAPSGDVFASAVRHTGDTLTGGLIRRIPAGGGPVEVLFEESAGTATLHYMAVHPDGSLYLMGPGKLSRWTAEAGLHVVKEDARFVMRPILKGSLDRMSFDRLGRLYFVTPDSAGITRFNLTTGAFEPIAGPGAAHFSGTTVDDSLLGAQAIAFNAAGDLLVCARQHNQVKRIPAGALGY